MPCFLRKESIRALFMHRTFQVFFTTLLIALLLFLAMRTSIKSSHSIGNDFSCYLEAAQSIWEGKSPYLGEGPFPYLYPLFTGFVLIPFLSLPYPIAVMLWFVVNGIACGYSIKIVIEVSGLADRVEPKLQWAAGNAVFWLLLPAIQNDLYNGQINLLVLLFCVLFFREFKRRRVFYSALFLSLAISVKVYPALLLLFLLARKEGKIMAYTILGTLVWFLLPVLSFGDSLIPILGEYFHELLWNQLEVYLGNVSFPMDTTLYGILCKYFPYFPSGWIMEMACGVLLLAVWIGWGIRDNQRDFPSFALGLLTLLLIQPLSETHHMVLFLPAMVYVVLRAVDDTSDFGVPILTIGSFFLCFTIAGYWKTGPFYFFSVLTLYGSMAWYHVASNAGMMDANSPYGSHREL